MQRERNSKGRPDRKEGKKVSCGHFSARGRVHRRKTYPVKDVGFLLFCFSLRRKCKRVLLRCPKKSSGLRQSLIFSTAATHSGRFFRHRRRSPRSPFRRTLINKKECDFALLFYSYNAFITPFSGFLPNRSAPRAGCLRQSGRFLRSGCKWADAAAAS